MATATKVGPAGKGFAGGGWSGDTAHYKLDPAYEGLEHVIVSSVDDFLGTETTLFPANEAGDVDERAFYGRDVPPSVPEVGHEVLLEKLGYSVN